MNDFISYSSPRGPFSRRKRQESILIVLLGALLSCICLSLTGFALYLGGYNPLVFPFQLTATAMAARNANCQVLIDQAIQASGSFCGETDSNNVCYGNRTIQAELVSGANEQFSERGDVVGVNVLRRLSAAPLDLESNEWGIAVFKVIANLPRSLPGETVTMIVFGNTTLNNEGGNLESFYFFSELGQISCEAVPFDGLMINSPDGAGIRINVNGAELTVLGSASLKAVKNGEMEVSIFDGSGRFVANGQEQYFGAGQKVRVGLGGENGTEAITGPSGPEPLSQAELNTACSLTGQYCSPGDIIPVSAAEAQQQLQGQITFTPTSLMTQTPSATPSPSITPTRTILVLPSWTPTRTPTRTITPFVFRTATRTRTPVPTSTRTLTPVIVRTNTPTRTNTPITPTNTPITPTSTPVTPTDTPITPTDTPITPTPTFSPTPSGPPTEMDCPSVTLVPLASPNLNELWMDITNTGSDAVLINRFYADWVPSPPQQKLSKLFLDGTLIWNISDTIPPSDIPADGNGNWSSPDPDRTIDVNATRNFVVQWQEPLASGTYPVHIVFDTVPSCQAQTSFTVP